MRIEIKSKSDIDPVFDIVGVYDNNGKEILIKRYKLPDLIRLIADFLKEGK